MRGSRAEPIVAIFGPTAAGKTSVAIELAGLLRAEGEDPVAVNCDSMQVYRGLEAASAAPTAADRERLEHRLVGVVSPAEEFSAGRYAELARGEIDGLLAAGRRPLVIGGTGLYLRAALGELHLKPPVDEGVRAAVESEIAAHGPQRLHAELDPESQRRIHPNDRKRIARTTELRRAGLEPHRGSRELWTQSLRHPTLLAGLVIDRGELDGRISRRVGAMLEAGAAEEVRLATEAGLSRTAAGMLGLEGLLAGDREAVEAEHRRYARRQMTWMRKMPDVEMVDRTGMDDAEVAARLRSLLVG